jgi:tetratricopeptide (TPR) repeat protein
MPAGQHQSTDAVSLEQGVAAAPTEDPADFVTLAEKLVREGHPEDAIAVLDTGIATDSGRPDAWRVKARIWRNLGDINKADNALDAALKHFRREPGLWLDKAELHILKGDLAEASKTFGRLTKIQPQNIEGWLGRGQSLVYEGKAKQALGCAEKVIALDGRSALGYALRGDSLLKLERWDEAFDAFTEATAHDSSRFDASSWAVRSDQFRDHAQLELAFRGYDRAIELDARNPEGWHGKGTVLKARGDTDGALAAFERASAVDTTFIAAFLDAGALCADRGDLSRALELFDRAKTARPYDPRPWIAIGGVHERRREYEEARAAYQEATRIDPEDARTWNSLGNSLSNLNQMEAALQSYQRGTEVGQEYGWPHSNLAQALLKLSRYEEAIHSIDRAIEIDPRNAVFWNIRLWILSIAGRTDQINATAERALEAAGDNVDLRVTVASFFADVGNVDRATELLRDVQPSMLRDEVGRLRLAESLLVIGDYISAASLLCAIDSTKLSDSLPVVRSFLHLLADRLAGATRLSEELLKCFLREFSKLVDHFEMMGREWGYLSIPWGSNGARRVLLRSELSLLDKLVLTSLIDLQEAKIRRTDLSFFADAWPSLS